ncbi:hypothetical protein PR202_gb15051 [Eleusine coracana subsp. coracana]|uniref:Uncharacterized protein n=1 Tax=Eleusine coracana subsp. coracana TaxID=191504 RepID=A0AAV5EXD6_ELECO|nr:hypothetical protein PR202_gb15051 [Eleusine coracana subsp. coracana]
MSVAADVVVREASPPLCGAKVSKSPLAVEVPDEAVRGAPPADAVAREREASPPLHEARASKPPSPAEVTEEVVGQSSDGPVKEALPPSPEAKASMAPPGVAVANDVVTSASPSKDLRESSEQEVPSVSSLLSDKLATQPDFPAKCSPMVVEPVCTQDSVECSPVVMEVVSTPDLELRKLSEHGSWGSGKKKVSFNMNVTTYENAAAPDQEEGYAEDEDAAFSEDSDDEDDYVDCKIDLLDEEEMSSEENKQESHESLFSLAMSNDQHNDDEVISPAPKSSDTSLEKESPLIKGNNLHCRSKYVRPVLNPVQNLSEWKEVKSLKTQQALSKRFDKENVSIMPDVDASQAKVGACNSSKKEVSVDASLSTWLASSDNSTVDKVRSKSPCSISSVSQDERSGVLAIDDLKKSSATLSPQRSPSHNREGAPILGTVGSYWSCMRQDNDYCSSTSGSGTNGIPNSTSKYREDKRVNWHSTPFNVRLDRALKKTSA